MFCVQREYFPFLLDMYENVENILLTDLVEHNANVPSVLSPRGNAFAVAVQNSLHIWDIDSKEISNRFECETAIDFIKWSPDAEFICCGKLKENVQLWNLKKTCWKCKINEDRLGIENIFWAPDSWHVLVISNFCVKLTVFSMSSTVAEINSPKPIEFPIVFSPCENYLVVAQRLDSKDYLSIYNCETWEAIKCFQVDTKDLVAVNFSPRELVISILESMIECKALFYSIDGRLLAKYATEDSLGFTSLSWSPIGNFIAVGNCFGEVKIFSSYDYEVLASYNYPEIVDSDKIAIYKTKEALCNKRSASVDMCSISWEKDEIIHTRPISLMTLLPEAEKFKGQNLNYGIKSLHFSNDEKYLAVINDNLPKAVFIYNMEKFDVCDIVILGSSIRSISWHQEKPLLALCCNSSALTMWTPACCIRYVSPFLDFFINNAVWCLRRDCIILNSRKHSSVLFLP